MAAKTLIDEAGGRGEGANVPEGNFDNEEIYPLPPSSPLVSNSPRDIMSSMRTPHASKTQGEEMWRRTIWTQQYLVSTSCPHVPKP